MASVCFTNPLTHTQKQLWRLSASPTHLHTKTAVASICFTNPLTQKQPLQRRHTKSVGKTSLITWKTKSASQTHSHKTSCVFYLLHQPTHAQNSCGACVRHRQGKFIYRAQFTGLYNYIISEEADKVNQWNFINCMKNEECFINPLTQKTAVNLAAFATKHKLLQGFTSIYLPKWLLLFVCFWQMNSWRTY